MSDGIGKVAFLKFFLHGGDPDALFQEGANEQMDMLASRTEQLVQSRVDRRKALATQAKALSDQLAEVPLLKAELRALEIANETVAALVGMQLELKDRVQADKQIVKHNQQIVTVLQRQLQELHSVCVAARSKPCYNEMKINEFSRRVNRVIAER